MFKQASPLQSQPEQGKQSLQQQHTALITLEIPHSTLQPPALPVFWDSSSHAVSEGVTQCQEQAHLGGGLPNKAR